MYIITLIVIIVINILFDTITIDVLMQVREKVGKSQNTEIFQWLVAPEGRKVVSKSRFAKAACAEPSGQMRYEKLHAVVARSACGSQKCEKLTGSEHFWKLRCRKSARRCGAKRISNSKCTKHVSLKALLEVEMSKKCTPFWPEAHVHLKSWKNLGLEHFWAFGYRFAWPAQRTVHLVKSEQNA